MTPLLWLALDTSGDQASVALGSAGVMLAESVVDGARRHAVELLPAIERMLAAASVRLDQVHGILLTDGPGSFTGLRIGATVAKALARVGHLPVRTASALLVIARAGWHEARTARRVLAQTDALRGELYAALYDMTASEIRTIREPHVVRPLELAGWEPPDLVARHPPRASVLLDLLGIPGATREIRDLETWEPEYGRPAEAQARWEAAHGRRLPDSAGTAR
jgi:tRNA threonylcarbamoyl adenosine modification protein YeaZ